MVKFSLYDLKFYHAFFLYGISMIDVSSFRKKCDETMSFPWKESILEFRHSP